MQLPCLLTALIFILVGQPVTAWSQVISAQTGYKDFSINGKTILLQSKSGKLKLIKGVTNKQPLVLTTDAPIVASAIDREGNIVVGDTNHFIKSFDEHQKTWHTIGSYTDKLSSIVFDKKNQCFLITNKGIVDFQSNTLYFPDSSFSQNKQIRYTGSWFDSPVCFLDSRDKLWLGFDQGEWGGNVYVFNTQERAFIRLNTKEADMELNPVNGFCEDQQNVYMSGGLSHIMLTHGSIYRFTNEIATPVLLSKDKETPMEFLMNDPLTGKKSKQIGITWKGGHRIGPSAYNPTNNCLYFYSQFGIFNAKLGTNLADIKKWQKVFEPKLQWTGGSRYAAGPAMNVLKMQFTADGTLLFLTEHNGLGVFDGKSLRFIQ
ncbi:hypothetical protein [Spirosoma radiotolerans]|uniref:Uncharacterized protein n=1 Tax=Spirosoma radiotolerans TaxID=1379870 RepID=A0A0E3ZWM0_9BACT|nr:hypothetical protein [Spirosoma radiotolerans]AKD56680.1 hypothetical protein SD10_19010 [Spirosoma radiotolerans]